MEEGSCAGEKAPCSESSRRKCWSLGNGGVKFIVPPRGDLEIECTEWKYADFQDPTKGFCFLISAVRILPDSP